MKHRGYCEYRVNLLKDRETGQIVAEIPALDISDYGLDSRNALESLKQMVIFHLESLLAEGKPIPEERGTLQGLYLKVRRPVAST